MRPRDRRALQLGGALVLSAFLLLRGLPWALEGARGQALRTEQLRQEVRMGRQVTRRLEVLRDSLAEMERVAGTLQDVLLIGQDGQTAAFDLTRRLTSLMTGHPVAVQSVVPRPDTLRAGPLARVTVEATLTTDFSGALEVLESVSADPSMAPDLYQIRVRDPRSPIEWQEELQLSLAVSAWYHAGDSIPDTEAAGP